ncbi:phage GP46 family protein [Sphingomonas sp. S6]|jgi:phage gp46-like protein|uniref:phage GP46 family protein n=1 Tax=Sphingomonas sp. S6 TaxID=3368600 RepID=UPI0028E9B2C6|nr:phage GP46 family protein [uncultured Sphingomonas sp.]
MDIATIWDAANSRGDWAVPAAAGFMRDGAGQPVIGADGFAVGASPVQATGLVAGSDIQTAVLISLFTDAAAGPDDVIPDGTDDPRGWWADPTIGSKLWLLARAKRTPQNLQLAIAYIRQALGWLTADGAASAIDVTAEWQAGGRLAGRIVVSHPTGTTAVPFDYAWKDLA